MDFGYLDSVESDLDLVCGRIYRFSSTEIDTLEEHRFIFLGMDDGEAYFCCCTSQKETTEKLSISRKYKMGTIIVIQPDGEGNGNELIKETYVDCNYPISHSKNYLTELFYEGKFRRQGEISEEIYDELQKAIYLSHISDNIPAMVMQYNFVEPL